MMGTLDKLRKLLRREKEEASIDVPREWVNEKGNVTVPVPKRETVEFEIRRKGKRHLPGLRTAKRVIAAILLIFNFFMSQATLLSAEASQPLFFFFLLNSFIFVDYLWKTRHRKEILEEMK